MYLPQYRGGHLVKVIWSFSISGTWLFAHYNININIYIIVAVLSASVFDFDQMTNDQMTAYLKKFLKHSRTAMKEYYLCVVNESVRECSQGSQRLFPDLTKFTACPARKNGRSTATREQNPMFN